RPTRRATKRSFPFGVRPAVGRTSPSRRSRTSWVSCPWRNVARSAPETSTTPADRYRWWSTRSLIRSDLGPQARLRRVDDVERPHAGRDADVVVVLPRADRVAAVARLQDVAALVVGLDPELDLALVVAAVLDVEVPPHPGVVVLVVPGLVDVVARGVVLEAHAHDRAAVGGPAELGVVVLGQ